MADREVNLWRPDCKAWIVADLAYQHFSDELKATWRAAVTKPHTSAYDAWMKWAIPHLLRGWVAPHSPPQPAGWSVRRLRPMPQWWRDPMTPGPWTPPPPDCTTWGLSAVGFHRPRADLVTMAAYVHTGLCEEGPHGEITWRLYHRRPGVPDDPEDPDAAWELISETVGDGGPGWAVNSEWDDHPKPGLSITWTPYKIDETGRPVEPHTTDDEKEVNIRYLRPTQIATLWPHPYPSRRLARKDFPDFFWSPP